MPIKKLIRDWVVPPEWYKILSNLKTKQGTDSSDEFTNFRLEKYNNIHKGERCFILASGPSINTQDLSKLENEICIGVSQFFLHPEIATIKPQYHCFAPQHAPFKDDTNTIIFNNYIRNYTFPVKAFVGTSNYEYSYENFLNKNPQYPVDAEYVYYTKSTPISENNQYDERIWNISKHPFSLRTVIYLAIQLAFKMGFKEIYLLGVDHDYLSDITRTSNHHFYNCEQSYDDKVVLSQFTRERWFAEYYNRWKEYRLIKEYLNHHNVNIHNATNGGMLDVFPRVNYDDIL